MHASILLLAVQAATSPSKLPLLYFALKFAALWFVVLFILSRFGWHKFARKYGSRKPLSGQKIVATTMKFGPAGTRYKNGVRLIASEEGLYFRVVFLFRAFHAPFLLPWQSIKQIEKGTGWLWGRYVIHVEDPAGSFHLRVSEAAGVQLMQYAPHLSPAPPPLAHSSNPTGCSLRQP